MINSDYYSQNNGLNMRIWQMQEAKAKLSELVKRSETEGPQDITVHGQSVAVVISRQMFDHLSGNKESLVDFIKASPLFGLEEINLERDQSLTREVDL
jgi:prevent-host-death family protein